MLFLMVETFSKDGIKIGFFPIEFIKKSFFEQCPKMEGRGVGGGPAPPGEGGAIWGENCTSCGHTGAETPLEPIPKV